MTIKYNSNFNETIPFSDTTLQLALATNAEQTFTIPGTNAEKYQAIFEYASNSNVFVGYNVTAASPGAGMQTDTNNLEFRPDKRYVKGGDILHFITPDAAGAYMGMSLRQLPS